MALKSIPTVSSLTSKLTYRSSNGTHSKVISIGNDLYPLTH